MHSAIINEDPLTRKLRLLQEQIELLTRELAFSHEREAAKTEQLEVCIHICAMAGGGGQT